MKRVVRRPVFPRTFLPRGSLTPLLSNQQFGCTAMRWWMVHREECEAITSQQQKGIPTDSNRYYHCPSFSLSDKIALKVYILKLDFLQNRSLTRVFDPKRFICCRRLYSPLITPYANESRVGTTRYSSTRTETRENSHYQQL